MLKVRRKIQNTIKQSKDNIFKMIRFRMIIIKIFIIRKKLPMFVNISSR